MSLADAPEHIGGPDAGWLVIVDLQRIFAEPPSPWAAPRFVEILGPVATLVAAWQPRVAFTRFVAPSTPLGSWVDYYRRWPFALQAPDAPDYQLVDAVASEPGLRIDATTFDKWTPELAGAVPAGARVVLAGVSTDCCVLSTALAAADDGRRVDVVADACAGGGDDAHREALSVLRRYGPLVRVVTLAEILADHLTTRPR